MAVGWACPRCDLVLAPNVAEHRCAPPSAGVTAGGPGPSFWGPTSVSVSPPSTVTTALAHHGAIIPPVTVTVQGSTADPALITEALKRDYMRAATRQPRVVGGSAA